MRVLMRAAFLVMCSAALLRAQGASGPPRGDVRGDVRGDAEEVITTLNAMWSAIEAGDVERYAAFVHPDFAQFGESDPYLFEG